MIYKNILSSFLLLFTSYFLFSQNLVPNPSFEDTVVCPWKSSQIHFAKGWSPFTTSPDYFHECWALGTQSPGTGKAYGGFFCYHPNNYNELMGIQLASPLILGVLYYIKITVNLTKGSCGGIDNLGVLFSMKKYCYSLDSLTNLCDSTPVSLTNFAHLYSSQIIIDTANWTTIHGSFITDSSYKYIIIGNLFDFDNTKFLSLINGDSIMDFVSCPNGTIYYYVDDICVTTDSLFLDCDIQTAINTNNIDNFIKIFPNPAFDALYIKCSKNIKGNIYIYNILGKLVYKAKESLIKNNVYKIDLFHQSTGIYFLKIISDDKSLTKKISIIK